MDKLVVPTVAQKPDIVLQLTKHDIQKDMKMTYLFDAKYRIEGRVNGVGRYISENTRNQKWGSGAIGTISLRLRQ